MVLHHPHLVKVLKHLLNVLTTDFQAGPGDEIVGGDLIQRCRERTLRVRVGSRAKAQGSGHGALGDGDDRGDPGTDGGVKETDPLAEEPHAVEELAGGQCVDGP